MTVYILWMEIHTMGTYDMVSIYKNSEDCLKRLREEQANISADIIEFYMQQYEVK